MAKRHLKHDAVLGSRCKEIYTRYKIMLEYAKFPMNILEECLSNNDYDSALNRFMSETSKVKTNLLDELVHLSGFNVLTTMFDTMWYYRRNLHFQLESIPNIINFDTTILDEIGQDICFDIKVGDLWYGVFVFKRNFRIHTRNAFLNWTFQIYSYTTDMMLDNARVVTQASTNPAYTFHIESSNNVRRCYIEHAQYDSCCKHSCINCNKCVDYPITYANNTVHLRLFSTRLRTQDDCKLESSHEVISPLNVLKCVIHSLECYKARDVITRKNGKKAAAYQQCKVHIASEHSNTDDKIVMLPLHEYVKEYRASHPHEYKGGHHASPVAHIRRGYYRKSRKCGDYIKKDNQFIYVGNKQGDYCFVRATHVNSKSDRVVVYQTDTKKS